MTSLAALHTKSHGDVRVKNHPDFALAKDQNVIPIVVHEFVSASAEFCITFVKAPQGEGYQTVVLTGLRPGENHYTNGDSWAGLYLPGIIMDSPFKLVSNPDKEGELMLAINEESDLVSKSEGEALYDENGKESAYLEARRQSVITNFENTQVTMGFTMMLAELDLLKEQTLSVAVKGDKFNLEGLHFIDHEKLEALSDEQFMDLRKRGFLPAIYAQMGSMQNVHRLMKLANDAE